MTTFSGNGYKNKSINSDTWAMLEVAKREGIETVWDRLEKQQPQCGYCNLGTSCRICAMGPCRVDPFGDGPQKGVCGADADIIVARNLARMIAAGASSHSDHGRDILETLHRVGEGKTDVYKVTDSEKLKRLAAEYGLTTDGKSDQKIAEELAWEMMEDYGMRRDKLPLGKRAPQARQDIWDKTGVYPRGIDRENVEMLHRTHMGVDNDWVNILLHAVRTSLSDGWGGSMVATELSDTLFGTPTPKMSQMNLGVLKADQVNIILHGHNPMLSEVIVVAAQDPELLKLAKEKGAKGINLAGVCCTGNEVLMRLDERLESQRANPLWRELALLHPCPQREVDAPENIGQLLCCGGTGDGHRLRQSGGFRGVGIEQRVIEVDQECGVTGHSVQTGARNASQVLRDSSWRFAVAQTSRSAERISARVSS